MLSSDENTSVPNGSMNKFSKRTVKDTKTQPIPHAHRHSHLSRSHPTYSVPSELAGVNLHNGAHAWSSSLRGRITSSLVVWPLPMASISDQVPLLDRRIDHWRVVDILWPDTCTTKANLAFLEQHGCKCLNGDAFDILRICNLDQQHDVGAVVLSNLNWRGRQSKLVSGFSEEIPQTKALYYELLLHVLRHDAPAATLIVLARKDDQVMGCLFKAFRYFAAFELHAGCAHKPIQSAAHGEVSVASKHIAHGGGQMVYVSLGPGTSLPPGVCTDAGFRLDSFISSVLGPVWFLGEGDASLACAILKFMQREMSVPQTSGTHPRACVREVDNVDARGGSTTVRAVSEHRCAFGTFGELEDAVAHSSMHGSEELCDQRFYASLYWVHLKGVKKRKCETDGCDRNVAPEDELRCCRTGCKTGCANHGWMCELRAKAMRRLQRKEAPDTDEAAASSSVVLHPRGPSSPETQVPRSVLQQLRQAESKQ